MNSLLAVKSCIGIFWPTQVVYLYRPEEKFLDTKSTLGMEFPGAPVVRTLRFHSRG